MHRLVVKRKLFGDSRLIFSFRSWSWSRRRLFFLFLCSRHWFGSGYSWLWHGISFSLHWYRRGFGWLLLDFVRWKSGLRSVLGLLLLVEGLVVNVFLMVAELSMVNRGRVLMLMSILVVSGCQVTVNFWVEVQVSVHHVSVERLVIQLVIFT